MVSEVGTPKTKLFILITITRGATFSCIPDVIDFLQKFESTEELMAIKEVITVCRLIQVNPYTSATGEISFSTARCLLTWNRLTTSQERRSSI